MVLNGDRVSAQDDGKVLKMDGGDSCTAMGMYLRCTFWLCTALLTVALGALACWAAMSVNVAGLPGSKRAFGWVLEGSGQLRAEASTERWRCISPPGARLGSSDRLTDPP